jgi:poly(A) polymerase Pap1
MANGYIQIDFNGTKVGLKFAYQALKWFALDSEKYAEEYYEESGMSVLGFANLLHCGYRNCQLMKKEDPTITLMEFYDYVSELNQTKEGQQVMIDIDTVVAESREFKLFNEKAQEAGEPAKKKTRKSGSRKLK